MKIVSNSGSVKAAHSNALFAPMARRRLADLRALRKVHLAAVVAATACIAPLPSMAAGPGNVLYQGMTLPSGLVKIGNDYWVSDHVFGFCKLVAGATGSAPGYVDQGSCNTAQVSPGQAAAKEATDPNDPNAKVTYAYVPDNSSKGRGVWRHTIKDGYVLNSVMLPNASIDGNRPMAVAMGPDGHLYVSLGRNNSIMRIRNPDPSFDGTSAQKTEKIGSSVVKVGPPALAFVGNALYLAENTGLTAIGAEQNGNATTCAGACTARSVNTGVGAPVFVASDATTLYLADLGNAYRYSPAASGIPGCLKPLGSGYGNVASLAVNPATDTGPASLYVADDPTAGTAFFKAVVYGVDPNSSGDCVTAGGPVVGGGGGGGGGGGVGAPPVATAPTTISGPATGATLPAALIQINTETWISDHLQGFCRLGVNGPETCVTNAALAPGQAVAVPSTLNGAAVTYVYVPDTASKGLGVWRLLHDGTRIVNATLLAPGKLSGARASAVAYGPDKKLYVVAGKNNSVMRIDTPEGNSTNVENIGFVSGRAGPASMTFRGEDLYFAEATGITTIPAAKNCSSRLLCTARTFASPVGAPVFVTSDGNYLYIADVSKAYRFTFAGTSPSAITELGTGFATISAIGFNSQPPASGMPGQTVRNLFVGDDTTAGTLTGTGRVWRLDMSNLTWP